MMHETVLLPVEDGQMQLFVARPTSPNGACVVVLQEIFGVNANIRAIADTFANQGYLAVAPDLFWRQEPGVDLDPADEESREAAMALMSGLDFTKAVDDAQAAVVWAR